MTRLLPLALAITLCPTPTFAGKIRTVLISSPSHYDKAQFQHTSLSSEGAIRLSRVLKPLITKAPIDAARIWDVVEDKRGNLLIATGDEGKILRVSADGTVTVAYDGDDSQILCLVAGSDGTVYAGTGPNGLIVRIDPSGNVKTLYDSSENYVWSLVLNEADGTLFAATGPHGRVYKVLADGKSELFFQSKQDHILCLARAADGTLYAGTDKQGLVYSIDAKSKGFVLFQAAQSEVRCLQVTDSAVYVGTSSPAGGRNVVSPPTGTTSSGLSFRTQPNPNRVSNDDKTNTAAPTIRERDRDNERATASSSATSAGGGENSIYRIGFDGSVRELFREKGLVLSLLKTKNRIYVGAGSKGLLHEIDESTRERTEIARLSSGQVQRLYLRRDGSILVAAADPGNMFVLQEKRAATGTVTSEVIDGKLVSRWGAISWNADVPDGTRLTVAVRSGNVAEPDDTWSEWSPELIDSQSAAAAVPNARFVQWRATLTTETPSITPSLRNLSIRYATLNQAPEVPTLESAGADSKEPKKLRFKWTATDANEDDLTFDLFVRKQGWTNWIRIEQNWGKMEYEWDTTTMPSGTYQMKVVASDRPDNNENETLMGERISPPILIAHDLPSVTLKLVGIEKGQAIFEAKASSTLLRLTSASFSIDSGKWHSVFPTDGLFDAREERFRFQSDPMSPGSHVMVLRIRDVAGNVGNADAVFEVK